MTRDNSFRTTGSAFFRVVALALVLVPTLAASVSAVQGQEPDGNQGPPRPHDPLAEHLLAPDLVMRHQAEIRLSSAQREALIKEMQGAQSAMVPLQFEANEASEVLERLVSASQIDEKEALAQAARLMEIETRVKLRHLTLLIRIKNLLLPEQQERLAALRSAGAR